MDSLSPQVVSAAKLPILNPNEFDLWKMRIEQYFLLTNYSLWEVILNGDSPVCTRINEDQIHDRLQKLVSQLEIHRVSLSQEDVNLKFLCSLPSEWKTHTLIWRNKADLEEQSLDDLFNSLKIYEAEIKHSSSTGTKTQNLAFWSSSNTDSTTDLVSAAANVSTIFAKMHVSSLPNVDSLSNTTDINLGANGPTSMGFDMPKVECYNCHKKGHFARECRSPKDSRRNGSYDWSYQEEEESANYALMVFSSSSSSSDNEVPSCSKAYSKAYAQLHSEYDKLIDDFQSDCESWPPTSLYDRFQPSDGYHAVPPPYTGTFIPPKPDLVFNTAPTVVKTDHPTFTVQLSPIKRAQDLHSVKHVEKSIPAATPKPASPKSDNSGKRRNRKACFVCKSVDHSIKDCDYHAKRMAQPIPRNYAHMVLTQSKPVSITVVRPVSTVVPKIKVTRPRHAHLILTKSKSPIRSHITRSPSLKTSNSPPKVTAVKAPVVSAAHGNPKGGKISRKGKIKTGKLDFDDVYFVKELKFNLFSVSQMCDKKDGVLFTNTECLVLSPDFKLPDESQVLLRVHRENNMYNVNLKNIVPSRDLTCLFAKATLDESNLWHRRLAHINFKTINKLVK
nr:ribonuclease H-like domain-containing protein [Tanacetum cinerariifolium]